MSQELIDSIKELTETNKKLLSQNIHLTQATNDLNSRVHINSEVIVKNTKVIEELKKHLE